MTLLEVNRLSKAFGGVRAVGDVSFSLAAGEMLALIGPNGAGKTTCFNLINGQLKPDGGTVHLVGVNITGLPPRQIWRQGVGRTFQIPATFRSMTVLENLQVAAASHAGRLLRFWRPLGKQYRDIAMALLEQVGLADEADRLCGVLAYGDVKRIELAIALAGKPRLLLMDEPTAGMAAEERHALMSLTRRLASDHGLGVLFTEHSLDVVFTHANAVVVMAHGAVIAHDSPTAIQDNDQVRELYLGSSLSTHD